MITEDITISQAVIGIISFTVLILMAIIFIAVIIYILFRAGNYKNNKKMASTSTKIATIVRKEELPSKKLFKKCNQKYFLAFKDTNSKEISLEVSRWEYVMHSIGEGGTLSFHGKRFIGFDMSRSK